MKPSYELNGIRVDLGGRPVLDIPALRIEPGCVTAIVGPNGAGKTSLLRVLALLQPPASGSLRFDGELVSWRSRDILGLRRKVTLVAQFPFLFHRSVAENVAYGLRARGLWAEDVVEEALAAAGLRGFAARAAWKLSGGETRLVALARALAIDPQILLLDEPTADVDGEHVEVIERLLGNLRVRGKTVLVATHDLGQVYRIADTIVSLVSGRVTPAPLSNVLIGHAARSGDRWCFQSASLQIELPDASSASISARAIAIDPEDIVLSKQELVSSARNRLRGHVVRTEHDARGVLVTVNCGRPLIARITLHSYEELELNLGVDVWLAFKSSAIHVLNAS